MKGKMTEVPMYNSVKYGFEPIDAMRFIGYKSLVDKMQNDQEAVDREWQGHGLGAGLLKHFLLKAVEVAQVTGVRLLLVHAKSPEAAAFYQRYGFASSPIDDLTLMLLMKDLRA